MRIGLGLRELQIAHADVSLAGTMDGRRDHALEIRDVVRVGRVSQFLLRGGGQCPPCRPGHLLRQQGHIFNSPFMDPVERDRLYLGWRDAVERVRADRREAVR